MRPIPMLVAAVAFIHTQAGPPQARKIADLGERDGAQSMALSPDGSFVLLGSEKGLESIQLASGRVTRVATGAFNNIAWAENGSLLAFEREDSTGATDIWSAATDARTGRLTSAPVRRTRGGSDSPAVSPDGSLIAFAGDDSVGQSINVMSRDGSVRRLVKLSRGGNPIGWTADGRSLLYTDTRGAIRVVRPIFAVPLVGGEPREIVSFNLMARARLSRNRTQLVFRSATDTIAVADTGGRVLSWFKMDAPEVGTNAVAMVWSSTNTLLFAEQQDAREVVAFTIATGAERRIAQPGAYATFPAVSPDGRSVASLVSVDGSLVVSVAPLSGGPARVYRTKAPPFKNHPIEWSPNGRYIAVRVGSAEHPGHANPMGLEFVDVVSGVARPSVTAPDVRSIAWSPDSRAVRYFHVPADVAENAAGSQIREVGVDGGDKLVLRRTGPRGGHNVFQDFDHFFGINQFDIVDLRTGQPLALDTALRAKAPANVAIRPSPSFSADGRWLAGLNSVNGQPYSELRLIDTRERTARTIPLSFRPVNVREGVVWFPDASHVITPGRNATNESSVYVVRLSDGSSQRLNLDGSDFSSGASLTPDAKTLITTRESRASTLRLMEFDVRR